MARGVPSPWTHQAEAAEHAWAGRHVVVSTGTASGKSLAYQLPVVAALTADVRATALYLSPTKALGADQLRAARALDPGGADGLRASSYDGDTPIAERDAVRRSARWVFTNPDMLHRGILPRHGRWTSFLRRLRYVVIDEAHAYRGVFGSHVALLLRRLRRICARYGAHPIVRAGLGDDVRPGDVGGRAHRARRRRRSPTTARRAAGRAVGLWEPPLLEEVTGENGAPVRRSAGAETSRILADLVVEGARTLAFVRSRRGAELTALGARRVLAEVDPELARAGRGLPRPGSCPRSAAALEEALLSGELRGVATTNALELGIDIAGLDAVVVAGFPGTRASFWQQAGRAGRSGDDALVLLVARDDPLDTFLVHHPQALLGAPLERCVLDPTNPYVLAPHLACAAAEMPLTAADVADVFGGEPARAVLDDLVAEGLVRHRRGGWFWALPTERPHGGVDIRGSGGEQVVIVETETGRMLGTVDPGAAHSTVHDGAVHLHQGVSYVVDQLDLEESIAHVHAEEPDWTTQSRSVTDIEIVETEHCSSFGAATDDGPELQVCLGTVEVTEPGGGLPAADAVRAGRRAGAARPPRRAPSRTRAVWYTLTESLLDGGRGRPAAGAGLAARRRARRDRAHAAGRDVRPVGHRRRLHRAAPRHRPPDGLRPRRPPRRGGLRRPGARGADGVAGGDPRRDRGLRVPGGVPVVRAVAEVRQRERPARQGGRGGGADRGAGTAAGAVRPGDTCHAVTGTAVGPRGPGVAPAPRAGGSGLPARGDVWVPPRAGSSGLPARGEVCHAAGRGSRLPPCGAASGGGGAGARTGAWLTGASAGVHRRGVGGPLLPRGLLRARALRGGCRRSGRPESSVVVVRTAGQDRMPVATVAMR